MKTNCKVDKEIDDIIYKLSENFIFNMPSDYYRILNPRRLGWKSIKNFYSYREIYILKIIINYIFYNFYQLLQLKYLVIIY